MSDNGWTAFKKEMPPAGVWRVLACNRYGRQEVVEWRRGGWWRAAEFLKENDLLWWRLLPDPPGGIEFRLTKVDPLTGEAVAL
jgi:hypothetical protein